LLLKQRGNYGQVLQHLDACRQYIGHVLIDLSGGKGEQSTDETLDVLIRCVRRAAPTATVGIAGGLGPDTIDAVYKMHASVHGLLSVDAETLLRDPVTDDVNLQKVFAYLDRAIDAVRI
jgi:hypothetical protein